MHVTEYNQLKLSLRPDESGSYRVFASGPTGEATGSFDVPFSELELENLVLRIGRTGRNVRRIESAEWELVRQFGAHLFESLFTARVRDLYRDSFTQSREAGRGLRITLSLTQAPDLMHLPWEYLYDEPAFLAISTWTPVVRYLDLRIARQPLPVTPPLRILAMVSSPRDLPPLDIEEEQRKLEGALSPLMDRDAIEIRWLDGASLRELQRELRKGPYHVFHYIGHGGYDRQVRDGMLLFEAEGRAAQRVSGVQLGMMLADHTSLRLAVLNACEGARTSQDDPFSGVAASLVQREIPAVVAMQFEITDRAAIIFADEFYAAIADGFPVDSALAEARKAIFSVGNDIEWGTPVLFMRVQDGRIFELPPATERAQHPSAIAAPRREASPRPPSRQRGPPPRPRGPRRRHGKATASFRRPKLLAASLAALGVIAVGVIAFALIEAESAVVIEPNSLVEIDASGELLGSAPLDVDPSAVVSNSGALWVADVDNRTVSRVDPVVRRHSTIPLSERPEDLASAGDAIWSVSASPNATVVELERLDVRLNDVEAKPPVGGFTYPGESASAAADDAGLWLVSGGLGGELVRLDPRTGALVKRIDLGEMCCPTDVATGGGAVWVADATTDNVVRVEHSNLPSEPIKVPGDPVAVAAGADGVWVVLRAKNVVARIDPSTNVVTEYIPVGRGPTAVAVGAGAVWVANSSDGSVSRIDVESHEVRPIELGARPQDIVVADGKVWVTVSASVFNPAESTPRRTARVLTDAKVESLDPALAYEPYEIQSLSNRGLAWQVLYSTCAKLMNYPAHEAPEGARVVPEVARSPPSVSSDGKTYTFTIRRGFRFSPPSNELVTATTFKEAFERSLSPVLRGPARLATVASDKGARATLDAIVGAKEYDAGRAERIRGIVARGNKLTIRLTHAVPDFPDRIAMPFFCAVPRQTASRPRGVKQVASAGPYYVAAYEPRSRIVLRRNPNYPRAVGDRLQRLDEIHIALDVPATEGIRDVEAGRADYWRGSVPADERERLARLYGPMRPEGRAGNQRYFVNPTLTLWFLSMNTSRRLFADARLRRALNHAIDRVALGRVGSILFTTTPTDQYLPPGMRGFRDAQVYPRAGDPKAAKRISRGAASGRRAILYTCALCWPADGVITAALAALGIDVDRQPLPFSELRKKLGTRGESFDLAFNAWSADYPDPAAILSVLLDGRRLQPTGNENTSYFNDPVYNERLAAAARLTGRARDETFGKLDIELARRAAPMVALANEERHDFFSRRMGCQVYNPVYGMDLASLCIARR